MAYNRQQINEILMDTVKTFGSHEWFRDVTVYNKHPLTGEATLELKVNYVPLFERKEIKNFALKYNLADKCVVVDRDGNPAQ